jgi:hypothetical protein
VPTFRGAKSDDVTSLFPISLIVEVGFLHSGASIMKARSTLLILGGLIALFAPTNSGRSYAQDKTVPKPREKEEFIDCEALLNDKLGKGITPEKNAVVLLWKAIGPRPEGCDKGMPPVFFKRLGIDEPSKGGDDFIDLKSYLVDHAKLEFWTDVYIKQKDRAIKRPWKRNEFPHIAAWLKSNEKPLSLVIEGSKRPEYYNPLISNYAKNRPVNPVDFELPAWHTFQELATALAARATLSTFDGEIDDAWRDLLACHQLGRLIALGGTLFETSLGTGIELTAYEATLTYLESSRLTSKMILDRLTELKALAPMPAIADKIDFVERITYLQNTQAIKFYTTEVLGFVRMKSSQLPSRDRDKLQEILGKLPDKLSDEEQKTLATCDWGLACKNANQWFDRIVLALRIKDRVSREKEVITIIHDIEKSIKEPRRTGTIAELLTKKGNANEIVLAVGDVLNGLLIPSFRLILDNQDRADQIEHNLHLAFALAAYKRDEGRYPAKLADLSPKYLATIPDDLFSGKALIYKPSDKGYLLYSVGANGKDDDGRAVDDEPPGDDLRVKMPLPPLEK